MKIIRSLLFFTYLFTVQFTYSQYTITKQDIKIALKDKNFKGVKVKAIDVSQMGNGYYSIGLSNDKFIQFKVGKGKVVEYYDLNGKILSVSQTAGYECQEIPINGGTLCTCYPDQNPTDCDKMIDDTGCKPIIDIDGKTFCVKGKVSLKRLKVNILIADKSSKKQSLY